MASEARGAHFSTDLWCSPLKTRRSFVFNTRKYEYMHSNPVIPTKLQNQIDRLKPATRQITIKLEFVTPTVQQWQPPDTEKQNWRIPNYHPHPPSVRTQNCICRVFLFGYINEQNDARRMLMGRLKDKSFIWGVWYALLMDCKNADRRKCTFFAGRQLKPDINTGWPSRLIQSFSWHQNKSSVLVLDLERNLCFGLNRRFERSWKVTL